MTVFTCEDNFDAMMTCVYEGWASRLGHSNIKLKTEPIGNLELFCDYRHVDADPEKMIKIMEFHIQEIKGWIMQMGPI